MDKERLLSLVREISPKYLIALYLVVVLAVGVAVSSVVFAPQEKRLAELTLQLQQEKQKVAVVENFILTNPDMEKHQNELQQALQRAEIALPDSMDVSVFLSQIERNARDAGIKLTSVKPGATTERAGYRELPVEVSVEGTFLATMSFLKKLEDGARFSIPSAFLMQQKQNLLATRLNLQIFCYGNTPKSVTTAPAVQPAALR
ncbi:MAG: type 4a pilus biogenesis protein PilO [Negativicutes bacterium]